MSESTTPKADHSFNLGFHMNADTPIRVRKIDGGYAHPFFVLEMGEYPSRITIHLNPEVAERIRFAAEEYLIVNRTTV